MHQEHSIRTEVAISASIFRVGSRAENFATLRSNIRSASSTRRLCPIASRGDPSPARRCGGCTELTSLPTSPGGVVPAALALAERALGSMATAGTDDGHGGLLRRRTIGYLVDHRRRGSCDRLAGRCDAAATANRSRAPRLVARHDVNRTGSHPGLRRTSTVSKDRISMPALHDLCAHPPRVPPAAGGSWHAPSTCAPHPVPASRDRGAGPVAGDALSRSDRNWSTSGGLRQERGAVAAVRRRSTGSCTRSPAPRTPGSRRRWRPAGSSPNAAWDESPLREPFRERHVGQIDRQEREQDRDHQPRPERQ